MTRGNIIGSKVTLSINGTLHGQLFSERNLKNGETGSVTESMDIYIHIYLYMYILIYTYIYTCIPEEW